MVSGTTIAELDRECYPTNPLTTDQLNKAITSPMWVVATEVNGKSYIMLECQGQGKVVIRRCGTAKGSRRLGLASTLIEPLKIYDCEATVREDNLPGLKLLQSQGFKVDSIQRGLWGNTDGVKMTRERTN